MGFETMDKILPGSAEVKRRAHRSVVNPTYRRSWPLNPHLLQKSIKDKEKHEQLSELLNSYSSNGLPPMPDLLNIGRRQVDEALFNIEPHWSSIVDNASTLTKRQHDQQEAIWELLNTEVQYLKSLRVITDLFMCCLINLQSESLLNEIDTEQLFSNINDIVRVNCDFWENHLLKVLKDAREMREPLNPSDMKDGFKKFPELFSPYTKYCIEQKPCTEYMKARYSDNDLFKTFVVWAETQKQCNRLKLTDLLVKPMQRLTKYSLLLQAILRKTECERQRRDLLEMIGGVDRFVSHVNATLRHKHDQERLTQIMGKIESYEAVESPNDESVKYLQEFNSNFDLLLPMPGCGPDQTRSLIMQSVLKLKDSASRIDVECLLFTDLLLICKSSKRMEKYKIIKPPMRVDRIIVQELKDKGSFLLIYLNEYHVPVSAFTFHADQSSVKIWIDHIKKAQMLYREVKDSTSSHPNTYSFLNMGEVVEEEVIRTTPLHTLSEHTSDTLLSPSSQEIVPDFSRSPIPSPVSPSRLQKSPSDEVMDSQQGDHHRGDSTKSGDSSSPSSHRIVQSSYSVPSFHEHSDEEKNKIHSSNASSANSDSSLPDILDDNLKQKLNQRRSSRSEKRYYTADAIQELAKPDEKDASIYKRLSWNFGTKDHPDERENLLRNKVQSTDSIRSIHSSSGVSSTGSLHLSPDGDICEEMEYESNNNDLDSSSLQNTQFLDSNDNFGISEQDKHIKSKSTTDISKLFQDLSTSEVKDGISSVDIPTEFDKKKYTHAQIMRMKKQLLLSSNVEAR
ncbi:hypothetical protein FSP39_009161 [Pinctada imbricata]|uniref:DH domain-containing protein n=1 Tax=Pinctada imbricata TaxID=66713 RepID=A0AA88YGL1_PINIB|nr:hypothetical protein FSP39_009161 [Pinctada imbricata]